MGSTYQMNIGRNVVVFLHLKRRGLLCYKRAVHKKGFASSFSTEVNIFGLEPKHLVVTDSDVTKSSHSLCWRSAPGPLTDCMEQCTCNHQKDHPTGNTGLLPAHAHTAWPVSGHILKMVGSKRN